MLEQIGAHPLWYVSLPVGGALAGLLGLVLFARFGVRTRATEVLARQVAGLVTAQELLARIDPAGLVERLDGPLRTLVGEAIDTLMHKHKPQLWELLPLRVKESVLKQARSAAPGLGRALVAEVELAADELLDVERLVAQRLDGALVRELVRPVLTASTWRATLIGLVLGAALALVGYHPVVAAGTILIAVLASGLATCAVRRDVDRQRQRLSLVLADHLATNVLTWPNIVTELVSGEHAERVATLVRREVITAVDKQASVAKPLISAAIGGRQYLEIKNGVTDIAIAKAPKLLEHARGYAEVSMAVQQSVSYRFRRLPAGAAASGIKAVLRDSRPRQYLFALLCGIIVGAAQFALGSL